MADWLYQYGAAGLERVAQCYGSNLCRKFNRWVDYESGCAKVEWPKQNDVYWYTGKSYPKGTQSPYTYRVSQLFMHLPDGSTHEMREADAVYQDNGTIDMVGTFYSLDSSRMRYDSTGQNTGVLYLADGTRYILGSSTVQRIDRNGNTLNYNISTRQWTDTMGRLIGMPWPANPGPGNYLYSLPGFNGTSTIDYTLKFQSLSATLTPEQGQTPALKVMSDYYLLDPNSPPTGSGGSNFPQTASGATLFHSAYSDPDETTQSYTYVVGRGQSGSSLFNPVVLAEIVLPNGQSYKFTYNIYGELTKVVYPTGGYQRYQHEWVSEVGVFMDPYTEGSRGMTSQWISPTGTGTDEAHWTYSGGVFPKTITSPDGTITELYLFIPTNFTTNFGYVDARQSLVTEERVYAPGGAMLRRTLNQYGITTSMTPKPVPPGISNPGSYTAYRNPRLEKTVSLILDTGGDALAKTVTYEYIDNGFQFSTGLDPNATQETNFQSVDQNTAQSGVITAIPAGSVARRVETVYLNNSAYRNRNILGLPTSVIVKGIVQGALQTVAQTDSFYDEAAYPLLTYADLTGADYINPNTGVRGNVTTLKRYVDAAGTSFLQTHSQFDQCGNLRNTWNERNIQTQTDFPSTYNHAYSTQVTTAVPDPSGAHGSTTAFTTSNTFDFNTGLKLTTTDINGQVTTFSYKDDQNNNDPLLRLRKLTQTDGGWTKYSFGDTVGDLFVLTETKYDATRIVKFYEYFDPMGRPSRTFSGEGGNTYIATDTIYDLMGRSWKESNAYRTTALDGLADPAHTDYWTTSTYDPLGRRRTTTLPDSSLVQTDYQGIYTTVTDQAGKQRRQKIDALGRVIRVDEPDSSGSLGAFEGPTQPTYFYYDTQGKVVHVAQGSNPVQHRYFKYDALGRLTYEHHVEQAAAFTIFDPVTGHSDWSRKQVYDETLDSVTYSGLVTSVYDARNIQSQFRYDNLNRIYQVNYSDGTPTITNKYDQQRTPYFNNGQLTEALTAATASIPATGQLYDFDPMGRVVHHVQTVGANTYSLSYGYNLGGALISETYPSGRTVSYSFDENSRLTQVSSGATVYASQFDYSSPAGLPKSLTLGNGAVESYVYNSRLQLESLDLTSAGVQLQHYTYKYGMYDPATNTVDDTKNNGQIAQIEGFTTAQKQWQQSFTYDSLGRLSSAREFRGDNGQQSYLLNYDYDVFGNRYQKQAQNGGNPFAQVFVEAGQFDQATNRFNTGLTYDNAGNITVDSKFRNRKFDYDANNRQKQSRNLDDTGAVASVFDAGGRRVANQISGSLTSVMVYDAMGKLVAEYNSTTLNGGTQYIFSDQQGSPRLISGTQGNIISRHDYLPFGEDLLNSVGMRTSGQGYGGTEAARQKYAGMEANENTNMAHTLWRQYDSYSARWTTPDPYEGSMDMSSPQSFNRYIYVNNDPVNHVDPTGLALADIGVYQTANPGVAARLDRWSLNAFRQATQPRGPGILGKLFGQELGGAKIVRFERRGEFKILGKTVPFYMATGQDKEYEEQATSVASQGVDLINSGAIRLTAGDEEAVGSVEGIAAVGRGVSWYEWFWVEGIPGSAPNETGAIGITVNRGVFYSNIANDVPKFWAPLIAHEGQHRMDYLKKEGNYAPGFNGDPMTDERRALVRQLLFYRRMVDRPLGSGPEQNNSYERQLIHLIITPHVRTFRN